MFSPKLPSQLVQRTFAKLRRSDEEKHLFSDVVVQQLHAGTWPETNEEHGTDVTLSIHHLQYTFGTLKRETWQDATQAPTSSSSTPQLSSL